MTTANAMGSMLSLRTAAPGPVVCSPDVHANASGGSREDYSISARFLARLARWTGAGGSARSRIGAGSLGAAAFDRVALGAPAQHPAGQVCYFLEAGLLQDDGRLRGTAAGAADRDDGPVAG